VKSLNSLLKIVESQTTEAALTKLQYLVGLGVSHDEVKIRLSASLVGEMG
jgi:hypothetical protein